MTRARSRLGSGLLNKVVLRFARPFWERAPHLLGYISAEKGEWAEWLNLYRYTDRPLLMAFNAARYAERLEGQSDEAVVEGAVAVLRTMYGGDVPRPTAWKVTRWGADPLAMGSYSYLPPGASPSDRAELGKPVDGVLFFAGEHTATDFPATVHGAYRSGRRAARELIAADA